MQEETLQSRAEIVESWIAIRRPDKAVLWAASITHGQHLALAAVTGKGIPLCFAEVSLCLAFQQLTQRRLADISQPVLAVHEVIAGK